MRELTKDEMITLVNGGSVMDVGWTPSLDNESITKINAWLARGDGVAVYTNRDLSHGMTGHCQIMSFGSPEALLESEDPPERLPDIDGRINWAYGLAATYRGEQL